MNIYEINDSKIAHRLCNFCKYLVHQHAVWISIAAEANHDNSVLLVNNRLINSPATRKMTAFHQVACVLALASKCQLSNLE